MFKAYFDDSCSDESEKVLLLGGCIQSQAAWADFSIRWEAALTQSPSIRYLHMREARGLQGEFAGWNVIDRDQKLLTLYCHYKRRT